MEVQDWVEAVLRRYARQTNHLLAGRRFGVVGDGAHAEALADALTAIGARVARGTGPSATFDASDPEALLTADHAGSPRDTAAERIDGAAARMPVVAELASRLAASGRLAGRRVGVCLVLEPKTAVLCLRLADAGAQVSVYAHPEETDPDVAAELRRRGLTVFADPDPDGADARADAFLAQRLHYLIDDGSRLIRRLAARPVWASELVGAAEETTSGLRALATAELPFPVVAVNDAGSKRYFDNAHGTGQSCLFTILDLLAPSGAAWPIAGRTVAVAGFGPVGEGFARHARALGARVLVADLDPVAELRARFAGYDTGPLEEIVRGADLMVSATGYPHTITPAVLAATRDGAAVAVAGGVDEEVDLAASLAAGGRIRPAGLSAGFAGANSRGAAPAGYDTVERLELPGGGSVLLLDRGGCINCTAGEGNPIEIMDLSFGVQLAALEHLATASLAPAVHPLPVEADRLVARLGLGEPA